MSIRADEYFSAFVLVGSACLGCYRSEKYEIYIDASIKSFLKMIGRTPFGLEATKRLSSGHTVEIYVQKLSRVTFGSRSIRLNEVISGSGSGSK